VFLPRRLQQIFAAAVVLTTLGTAQTASATAFNIEFGTGFAPPPSSFGAAAGQALVWQTVATGGGAVGLGGGAMVSVVGPVSEGSIGSPAGPTDELMLDYFVGDFTAATWLVSFSGLVDGAYDVYLYDPANAAVSTGNGTVNGTTFTSINGAYSSPTLALNSNYLLLQNILVTGGSLNVYGDGTTPGLSGLAGIQLQDSVNAVPEPSTLGLLGIGAAGVFAVRRKRSR
jgi:hypothetical protein